MEVTSPTSGMFRLVSLSAESTLSSSGDHGLSTLPAQNAEKSTHSNARRYCKHGHDTWQQGRDSNRRCRACRREYEYDAGYKREWRRRKAEGGGCLCCGKTENMDGFRTCTHCRSRNSFYNSFYCFGRLRGF